MIKKIDEPTKWVSSLIIMEEKNGKPRVYMGPSNLNSAIRRKPFKLPTREEIMSQYMNTKYPSKVDASSGFWQMKLDDASSKLCMFDSPFGKNRFLRLLFRIVSVPLVHRKTIYMICELLEGVDTSGDDVIVWGSTKAEPDERFKNVLDATRKANLRLNEE